MLYWAETPEAQAIEMEIKNYRLKTLQIKPHTNQIKAKFFLSGL